MLSVEQLRKLFNSPSGAGVLCTAAGLRWCSLSLKMNKLQRIERSLFEDCILPGNFLSVI